MTMEREASFAERLTDFQMRRPGAVVSVALALALGSLPLVGQLSLNGDFTALLPGHKPSVRDLEEIKEDEDRDIFSELSEEQKKKMTKPESISGTRRKLTREGFLSPDAEVQEERMRSL